MHWIIWVQSSKRFNTFGTEFVKCGIMLNLRMENRSKLAARIRGKQKKHQVWLLEWKYGSRKSLEPLIFVSYENKSLP